MSCLDLRKKKRKRACRLKEMFRNKEFWLLFFFCSVHCTGRCVSSIEIEIFLRYIPIDRYAGFPNEGF